MEIKQYVLNELSKTKAEWIYLSLQPGWNPYDNFRLSGQEAAYGHILLHLYGRNTDVGEQENQEFLYSLIKENVRNNYRTGIDKLDEALIQEFIQQKFPQIEY